MSAIDFSRPMLGQRYVRLAAVDALSRAELVATTSLQSPGDWATPPEKLPAILVRAIKGSKAPQGVGAPNFTCQAVLEIEARVEGATEGAAQDAIEELAYGIEEALFGGYWINQIIEMFSSVESVTEVTADGKRHFGGMKLTVSCQFSETFTAGELQPTGDWPLAPPADPTSITSISLDLDTVAPFDATGTYSNPPFPNSVNPAPRTAGPDGRSEGGLNLTLPT